MDGEVGESMGELNERVPAWSVGLRCSLCKTVVFDGVVILSEDPREELDTSSYEKAFVSATQDHLVACHRGDWQWQLGPEVSGVQVGFFIEQRVHDEGNWAEITDSLVVGVYENYLRLWPGR